MANTNIQIWNPSGNNMETDAQYTADAQRSSGASDGQVFYSSLANKLFYQVTTYLAGLFQSLANKGYSTSDGNLNGIISACSNLLTRADLGLKVVPYASSVTFDASTASSFKVVLAGNLSFSIVNAYAGQVVTLIFNSGSGNASWSITWPGNVVGYGSPDLTDANVNNIQSFICDDAGTFRPIGVMTES